MALGKQAKILTDKQVRAVLAELGIRRYPIRDRVMFLFSIKAGMRAKEIASVTWAMVTDAEGEIADVIALQNRASKGRGGGRHIPMHPDIKDGLTALQRERGDEALPDWPVIHSERPFPGRRNGLVPSPLCRPWHDRLFKSQRPSDVHHAGRPKDRRGWRQPSRRAAARGPFEFVNDGPVHRRRSRGAAKGRCADLAHERGLRSFSSKSILTGREERPGQSENGSPFRWNDASARSPR
jgi:hypothetical protein